ncbi:unnamed protein product [Lepeophtheirus salmonis]|uniref:(salmon louse) hypothetical protein n=1 Tax=Lepeophtheirus salmonis TaxID=72036 RepID=A0A7R8CN76_LEPSM|nr:unnamed protein product [Lepeophtheirus salmonis]CAF2827494.1 unnamed protein product [Lepeophtheirus salmonis]
MLACTIIDHVVCTLPLSKLFVSCSQCLLQNNKQNEAWIRKEIGYTMKKDLGGSKSVLQDHILYLHRTGVYNRLTRENDPEEKLRHGENIEKKNRPREDKIGWKIRKKKISSMMKKILLVGMDLSCLFLGQKTFDELSESESEEEEEEQMIQDTFDISDDEEDVLFHTQLKEKRQLEKNIRKIKVEVCDDENIANPESDEDDEPPEEIAIIKKTNEILPQNNETHYPKKNEENVLVKDENSYDPEALTLKKQSKSENSGHHFLERNEDDSHIPTPEQKPEIKSKEPSTQSLLLKNKQNLTKSPYCIEPPTLPRVRFNRISKQNKTLLEKLLSSEMKKGKKVDSPKCQIHL